MFFLDKIAAGLPRGKCRLVSSRYSFRDYWRRSMADSHFPALSLSLLSFQNVQKSEVLVFVSPLVIIYRALPVRVSSTSRATSSPRLAVVSCCVACTSTFYTLIPRPYIDRRSPSLSQHSHPHRDTCICDSHNNHPQATRPNLYNITMADGPAQPKPSSSVKLVLLGEAAVGKVHNRRYTTAGDEKLTLS
jgi:hypothetical protein